MKGILPDTSVWIDFFRGRDPRIVKRLRSLLFRDLVVLAVPVRIELVIGIRKAERARILRVLEAVPVLFPTESTWREIERFAIEAAKKGERFAIGDLVIAAVAGENDLPVWSLDQDFQRMARLGFVSVADPGVSPAE